MNRTLLGLVLLSLAACSDSLVDLGGVGAGINSAPPAAAVGGVWEGTDSDGRPVLALTTESGLLTWISLDTGEQGSGAVGIFGNDTNFSYTLVAPLGLALADGSTSADCDGDGSIRARESWLVNVSCTTSLGGSIESVMELTFNAIYFSSLGLIGGDYDDSGLVFSVSPNGEVFEQDPVSGCVLNGQVRKRQFNLYDVSISYSNCNGDKGVLNGSTFTGLATLDDSVEPETAVIGVTGAVGEETYSLVLQLPRL
jgi:hypothetical protein